MRAKLVSDHFIAHASNASVVVAPTHQNDRNMMNGDTCGAERSSVADRLFAVVRNGDADFGKDNDGRRVQLKDLVTRQSRR